jgi:2-dehydropantoate 2-reductase
MTNLASVVLVGPGAIGSLYAGMLSDSGVDVAVVARSAQSEIANGIQVDSVWKSFVFRPSAVYATPPEKAAGYLIVTTKVTPEWNPRSLTPLIGPHTVIVLIQNGIFIETPYRESFPQNEIISAIAFVCTFRLSATHVSHTDYGRLVLGVYPNGNSESAKRLHTLFCDAGVPCELATDIQRRRWIKLLWNAAYNPLCVLTNGQTTAEIMANPETRQLAQTLMVEVQSLARLDGVEIPDDLIDKNLKDTEKMVPYKPSMLLDVEANRPLETEVILGNAVRFARQKGATIPHLETLYALLAGRKENA